MINGVTKLIMTKADVLDTFDELNICTAYKIDGKETTEVPFQMSRLKIEPALTSFPGWNQDTSTIKSFSGLPAKMKTYIEFINKETGVDIHYISNGPGRDQIVPVY